MRKPREVGWHYQLNAHELEQTLGNSEGQGSLVCCSPWGCKESDTTEQQHEVPKKQELLPRLQEVSTSGGGVNMYSRAAHTQGYADQRRSQQEGPTRGSTGACVGRSLGQRTGGGQLAAISSPAAWGGSSARSEGGSPWGKHTGSAAALTLDFWAGVRDATPSSPQTTVSLQP